jgi:hypothetical protein
MNDDEFNEFEMPHVNMCNNYLENYIIPDYVSFYIATGYYRNGLRENSFYQYFNSAVDIFNLDLVNLKVAMENTKKLLNIKYGLEIIEEYPILKVKEI